MHRRTSRGPIARTPFVGRGNIRTIAVVVVVIIMIVWRMMTIPDFLSDRLPFMRTTDPSQLVESVLFGGRGWIGW